jgi:ParB family chromosome partitioning protein
MVKREFDSSIVGDMKTAVSGSFADNIKMIDIGKLLPHRENFYSMSDIELLAEDIKRQGLKENLVVRAADDGFYTVISGHRRRQALIELINDGRVSSRLVPCYINPAKSDDEEVQDLIMLNATTRVISDSDMMKQYERLKAIFEAKKANGENIRIRDKIAETLGISNGKVAMIEAVAKNPEASNAVKFGGESIYKANSRLKEKTDTDSPLSTLTTSSESLNEAEKVSKSQLTEIKKKKAEISATESIIECVTTAFDQMNLFENFLVTDETKAEILEMLIEKITEVRK